MPELRPDDYAGSAVCRDCHAAIVDSYSKHPMALSTSPAFVEQPIEDFEQASFSPNAGNRYYVERKEGRVIHHEVQLDSAGEPIYDQGVEVHYAIGSGKRGRSYLIDLDGVLYQSPISWYTQNRRWDLSPSYRPAKHPRFDRRATDRCLQCHVGKLNDTAREPGRDLAVYKSPPFVEAGIGCERCHGPAQRHVEFHRGTGRKGHSDPIVNPAKLDPVRRDSVCNQCHLQGELQILRYGRSHEDFRPGDQLGDIWSVFIQGSGVDDQGTTTTAVSQVQQMHVSECYIQSQGKLGCTSCHDPHRDPPESERAGHFDQRCQKCHGSDGCAAPPRVREQPPASGSCIACHMPRLSAQDVPHTTQTDHRVPRVPEEALSQGGSVADQTIESLTIFQSDSPALPEDESALIHGLMLVERAKSTLDPVIVRQAEAQLQSVAQRFGQDVRIWDGLGICASIRGRPDEAVPAWMHALTVQPRHEGVLYSMVLNMVSRGEVANGLQLTARYLEINPWNAEVHYHRSKLLLRSGQLAEAVLAGEKAVELNPSVPESYEWLARVYQSAGQVEKSERMLETLKRLRGVEVPAAGK